MNENEKIKSHIAAAFDSVNLINDLITKSINEELKSSVDRNVKHLELMLTKDFFVDGLTPEQKTEIETSISNGNSYIELV